MIVIDSAHGSTNRCLGCMEELKEKSMEAKCPQCGYMVDRSKEASLYLFPGTVLSGKYLIGRTLGQGGFGITYLAWDMNLDIRIAVKEFFPQGLVSRMPGEKKIISYNGAVRDQFVFGIDSFLKEAKTLARFENHPNIVTVRDFFKENGTAYMVMSYIEGLTLIEYLNRAGGKIPVDKAVQIIMPVTDALREIHEMSIMHRDISPDNIFIDIKGRVVLIDFGAARQEMREKSKSVSVILKAGYAPEEQYRSRGKQGPWTDIYATAATMYRSITGQVIPEAIDRLAEDDLTPPSCLGVVIEQERENVLLKALAVKAGDRFQTVEEFQAGLMQSALAESPAPQKREALVHADGFELVQVGKAGTTYTIPTGIDDASTVQVTGGYLIAKTPVVYDLWYTVKQWAEVNGYCFANPGREGSGGKNGAAPTAAKNEPVTVVNLRDCIVWLNALSEMQELAPVYRTGGRAVIKDARDINASVVDAVVQTDNNGYRLPTSIEWEMAARWKDNIPSTGGLIECGGRWWTPGNYASGATADYRNRAVTEDVAWCYSNSETDQVRKTQPVGQKNVNTLGLYDMSGNVWEWCFDLRANELSRFVRGGSWFNFADRTQVGYLLNLNSSHATGRVGFRFMRIV